MAAPLGPGARRPSDGFRGCVATTVRSTYAMTDAAGEVAGRMAEAAQQWLDSLDMDQRLVAVGSRRRGPRIRAVRLADRWRHWAHPGAVSRTSGLIRTLALGLDPQEAIDAPAFHTNGRPPTRSGARHPPCECGPNGRTAHGFDPLAHTFNARASRPGLTRGNRTTDRSRAHRRPAGRLIPPYHLEVRRDHSDRNEERSSPRTQKTRSNPHPRDPREANR